MTEDDKLNDVLKTIYCTWCKRTPKTKEELLSSWFISRMEKDKHFCSENCAAREYGINLLSQQTTVKTIKNRDGSFEHKATFQDPVDARITEQDHRLLKAYNIIWPIDGYNILTGEKVR
jgi:hypothetical protein